MFEEKRHYSPGHGGAKTIIAEDGHYISGASTRLGSFTSRRTRTRLADGGECCTQLPTRAIENACCLLQITAMQEQDGELDAAVCLPQCLARLLAAAPVDDGQH
jgi:hypothetical protein